MKTTAGRLLLMLGVATGLWLCNGTDGEIVATAEAVVGRPATPVSYAGVARRTVRRTAVVAPGTPANRGGPVNRVGVR